MLYIKYNILLHIVNVIYLIQYITAYSKCYMSFKLVFSHHPQL